MTQPLISKPPYKVKEFTREEIKGNLKGFVITRRSRKLPSNTANAFNPIIHPNHENWQKKVSK